MILDWKNEKDYAYCDELDANGWAFEFLRRNPEYQKDWKDYSRRRDYLIEKYGSVDKQNPKCYSDIKSRVFNPPIYENENREEWINRVHPEALDPKQTWFEDYYKEKWCLKDYFPDPYSVPKNPPSFDALTSHPIFPDFKQIPMFFESDDPPSGHWQQLPGEGVVVFDLSMPLDPQFNEAKKVLNKRAKLEEKKDLITRLKKKSPGNLKSLFVTYLRALDGKFKGASNKEIGVTLFSYLDNDSTKSTNQSKKAYDTLKQAETYLNYRFLGITNMSFSSDR